MQLFRKHLQKVKYEAVLGFLVVKFIYNNERMAYSLLHDVVLAPKNGPIRKITGCHGHTPERILIRADLFGIGELPKVLYTCYINGYTYCTCTCTCTCTVLGLTIKGKVLDTVCSDLFLNSSFQYITGTCIT